MKVLVTDPIADEGIELLLQAGDLQVDVRMKLPEDEIVNIIGGYQALMVRSETRVTKRIIEAASQMKIIGRAGIGVDNIDVDAATEKGILVVNSPEGNTIAATEHTMAMMLALARNIPQAVKLLKSGTWDKKKFMGLELRDKVLGVVGLGKIGSEVARRASALEMRVIAYDPFVSSERAQQMGVQLRDFKGLIGEADFITVHLPLTKDTNHLISVDEFAAMKTGVRILNVARGGIVDEEALYEAVKSGKVAGAALDVFEKEPTTDSPLFSLDQVIVTPHLGASTAEAQVAVSIDIAQDILRALKGEIVRNAVNIPSVKSELWTKLEPFLKLAEKLGRFAAQVSTGHINRVEIMYNGDIARHDLTFLTNTFLKGLLKHIMQEGVNYVNAPLAAASRGIRVFEQKTVEMEDYTNLITITVKSDKCEKSLSGTLFGDNQPRIVRIDGYTVDAVPEGHMLVIPHIDKPRIIGPVGVLIGQHNINIAGMQVGRKKIGGKAVMFLNIDAAVPEATLTEIAKIDGVIDVKYVHL